MPARADDDRARARRGAVDEERGGGEPRLLGRDRRARVPGARGRGERQRGEEREAGRRGGRAAQRRPSRRSAAGVKSRDVAAVSHTHIGYSLSRPSAR